MVMPPPQVTIRPLGWSSGGGGVAGAQAGPASASKEEPSNKGVPVTGNPPVSVEEAVSEGAASKGASGDGEAEPVRSGIMVTSARQQVPTASRSYTKILANSSDISEHLENVF